MRYDIKRDVLECGRCGFVFLRPPKKSSASFYKKADYRKKYGPKYGKRSKPKERFGIYYPFQKDIIGEIVGVLKPNMKVLDVGCSTGQFLAALKGKIGLRVGIELSREDANFIKNNLDFKVYNEPIERLKLPEGPFDLITSLQVLEHVENPLEFLKKIGKHLKPNGLLYLELPNIDDAVLKYYQASGYANFYYREPHLSYFSKSTLNKLLDKAGFDGEIKTVQRYNFLNHVNWILTNAPQPTFMDGNRVPRLVSASGRDINPKVKKALNDFMAKADRDYKNILSKYGLGESLTFLGRKK